MDEETRKLVDRALREDGRVRSDLTEEDKHQNHELFIRLWSATSRTPNYDKDAWKAVEKQMRDADLIP